MRQQLHTHTHTLTLTPQMKGSSIFSVQQDTTVSSLTGTTWTTVTKPERIQNGPMIFVKLKLSDKGFKIWPQNSSSSKAIFLQDLKQNICQVPSSQMKQDWIFVVSSGRALTADSQGLGLFTPEICNTVVTSAGSRKAESNRQVFVH